MIDSFYAFSQFSSPRAAEEKELGAAAHSQMLWEQSWVLKVKKKMPIGSGEVEGFGGFCLFVYLVFKIVKKI